MLQEIKLIISENSKVLDTVIRETDTKPSCLLKSLEEFQRTVNAAFTNMIDHFGDSGDTEEMEEEEKSDEDTEDNPVSPRKRKK